MWIKWWWSTRLMLCPSHWRDRQQTTRDLVWMDSSNDYKLIGFKSIQISSINRCFLGGVDLRVGPEFNTARDPKGFVNWYLICFERLPFVLPSIYRHPWGNQTVKTSYRPNASISTPNLATFKPKPFNQWFSNYRPKREETDTCPNPFPIHFSIPFEQIAIN